MVDHRRLHRMQLAARTSQILDRHDLGAVDLTEQLDARIDRLVHDLAVDEPAERHGTGTAITLVAAFLGPGQRPLQPQVIEQRPHRVDIRDFDNAAARNVPDFGARDHGSVSSRDRWNSQMARSAGAHDNAHRYPRSRNESE